MWCFFQYKDSNMDIAKWNKVFHLQPSTEKEGAATEMNG